ncbi:MAG: ABC transporter substrate binding protein, partial [Thermodesulfobacteriota bacterium]
SASYFTKATAGFKASAVEEVAGRGLKSAQPDSLVVWTLDKKSLPGAELRNRIIDRRPDLVLAVGQAALLEMTRLQRIPVVYLLARDGARLAAGHAKITGIEMTIPPARQLAMIAEALPAVKRVGVIHSQAGSNDFVREAASFAALRGLELLSEEAKNPRQIPGLLAGMAGRVDAFWMLPDPAVTTASTLEAMLHFSVDNQIPLLAFADKYLELGAVMALSFDVYEMGVQAGRLARRVAAAPHKIPASEPPARINLQLNSKVAARMGVMVNTAAVDN